MRYRRSGALALAAASALSLSGPPAPASAYPPGDEGYLDYAEMVVAIEAIEASHPAIVELFSIGRSHEGRELWAAKVSDNVERDEEEPEVAIDAGMHAREHMTTDVAVTLLRNLADGHAAGDARMVAIVDGMEVFIFFNLNPDGTEFDHASGVYQGWRKNRQPTPGSDQIGTDINRNFGYQWGTSSLNAPPWVETYRGPAAWSAPETRAFRDWVDGRVADGRQQVNLHVTLHQFGRVILYPFGYTTQPVPADMNPDDHATLVAIADEMARRSGYASAQSGAWAGVNVGNQMDWLYAAYRMVTLTIEMGDAFYMGDEAIALETPRVLEATYWAIEQAACPHAVVGLGDVYCDPSGFVDIAASPFRTEIRWAARSGVTEGCAVDRFCPLGNVTREEMASFLARVLDLPDADEDHFRDDDGSIHEEDINRLADAGITRGCGSDRYCPTLSVSREQMASFLARAYDLADAEQDAFADDEGSVHEDDINRLAAAEITLGCDADRFCPTDAVTREEMVTFLYRAELIGAAHAAALTARLSLWIGR